MNFSQILNHWYSVNKRSLPWRETKNPYYIWLSEIILQQTQVKQGLPYYEDFVSNYPSVYDLANASEDKVLKLWQGLGYYSRARNLHFSAKYIVNELDGNFPNKYNEILELKGVGDYTASAIASICFNESCAVVDGNVYRVLSRYFGVETPINSSQGQKEFKALAQELLPEDNIGEYNQAIMEFGAKQCKPQSPNCNDCPLNNSCEALKLKKINELPVKLKKIKVKKRYFNYIVFISKDNKTILNKRTGKGIWQNLFEFPLIETKTEVNSETIITQNIFKELVNTPFEIELFNDEAIVHRLSHQHLHTRFWIVRTKTLNNNSIAISKIGDYAVPTLISNFIKSYSFQY